MYKDNVSFGKMKGKFFESFKEENVKCLEPNESCTEKLINSHTVQDSRILSLLACNQHVICIKTDLSPVQQSKLGEYNEPDIMFDLISIHTATTFKGLCNNHDTKIFYKIDTQPIDLSNAEHVFLLTYRAILKELATLIKTAKAMQRSYLYKVELGEVSGTEPSTEGIIPVIQIGKAYDFYEYKKKFDNLYLTKEFSKIRWKYLELYNEPTFAVSSIFTPMEMSSNINEEPERISVNIFPYEDKIHALFSCLAEEEKQMNTYTDPIFQASDYYQKYLISKLVLRNCENIVFSPDFFSKWSMEKKENILAFFKMTMFGDYDNFEHKDLYIF